MKVKQVIGILQAMEQVDPDAEVVICLRSSAFRAVRGIGMEALSDAHEKKVITLHLTPQGREEAQR